MGTVAVARERDLEMKKPRAVSPGLVCASIRCSGSEIAAYAVIAKGREIIDATAEAEYGLPVGVT